SWLNHQGARDGECHGWCVEPEVHKTLCHVLCCHTGLFGEVAQIQDAFVCNKSVQTGVEQRVVLLESMGQIVCRQYCNLSGFFECWRAHDRHIRPGDGQYTGCAVQGRSDRCGVLWQWTVRIGRQVWLEVLSYTDGSNTGTAATVWDSESFV